MRVERTGIASPLLKRSIVLIYWLVLSLSLIAVAISLVQIDAEYRYRPNLIIAGGALSLAAVVGWRLRRSVGGRHAARPTAARTFRVLVPLFFLAMVGTAIALLGLVWTILGIWVAAEPYPIPVEVHVAGGHGVMSGALLICLGLVCVALGIAANVPILRILIRRRAEASSPSSPETLETPHD